MHTIGFSTGAIALADFRAALRILERKSVVAVELSALRPLELYPLLEAIRNENLVDSFEYVSFHAPSSFDGIDETEAASAILSSLPDSWPVVLHPDASSDLTSWAAFGDRLLVENMDRRKPAARTRLELQQVFTHLPQASFCFDIGHARQVDPTMLEASQMLSAYGSKVRQLHISEVNTNSRHERLSDSAILAFREVAHLIPAEAVLILETPTREDQVRTEMERVEEIFVADQLAAAV